MRRSARNSVRVAAGDGAGRAAASPPSARAPPRRSTIDKWEAGTCATDASRRPECTYESPSDQHCTRRRPAIRTSASPTSQSAAPAGENRAKRVQVELPTGLNVNPQAVPQCSVADLQKPTPVCAASEVGHQLRHLRSPRMLLGVKVPIAAVRRLRPGPQRTANRRSSASTSRSAADPGGQRVRLPRNRRSNGRATTTSRSSINNIEAVPAAAPRTASSSTAAPGRLASSPCRAPATATRPPS